MGLAGPKVKNKIGKDPRNTFWSTDTSRFGHKYLESLGWQAGDTLGDKNSSYHASGHITAASQTGVRIAMKADLLGIGAKAGAQDECTGLLGFEGLLGRLNGNEAVVQHVQKEEERRKEAWIESKWGMRFVRGEVWKADDISKLREKMIADGTAHVTEKEKAAERKLAKDLEREMKSIQNQKFLEGSERVGKRKRADEEEEEEEEKEVVKKEKKEKKEKTPEEKQEKKDKDAKKALEKLAKKEKKALEKAERKDKRSKSKSTSESAATSGDETESKTETKAERKERRENRRKEKAEKKARKAEKKDKKDKKKSKKRKSSESDSDSDSEVEAPKKTLAVRVRAAPVGRAAIRHRFIAAKRNATMDLKSLNEIFMVAA